MSEPKKTGGNGLSPEALRVIIRDFGVRVGGAAVDRDGVVLDPTDEQRKMQQTLSGRFPRGPGL